MALEIMNRPMEPGKHYRATLAYRSFFPGAFKLAETRLKEKLWDLCNANHCTYLSGSGGDGQWVFEWRYDGPDAGSGNLPRALPVVGIIALGCVGIGLLVALTFTVMSVTELVGKGGLGGVIDAATPGLLIVGLIVVILLLGKMR